ncbi:unnamed protein product [Urochloa humidicola]
MHNGMEEDETGGTTPFRDVTNTHDGGSRVNSTTPVLDPKERKKMMDRERARARRAAMSLEKREDRDSYHGTEVMILEDYRLHVI